MASFSNNYTHRKVADTAAKACEICFKPSTSVLVTPENKVGHQDLPTFFQSLNTIKDFFYVCPAHLKDKGFCSPVIDEAAAAAKKKREMEAEVERVKQEFEEKQKKKKEKEKEKEKKGKDKEKDTEDDKKGKEGETKDEKKSDEKVKQNPTRFFSS